MLRVRSVNLYGSRSLLNGIISRGGDSVRSQVLLGNILVRFEFTVQGYCPP